jgi:hypothetical protein
MSVNTNVKNVSKIIVFDLDETIGYFKEFSILWNSLRDYLKKYVNNEYEYFISQEFFDEMLDLFPEFLRPDILSILFYLKEKRKKEHCDKILIYTNNQGPKNWVEYIQNYLHKKINYDIFEQIICAFKINGKVNELCRKCATKSIEDLLYCAKMPANTQVVFIDDILYQKMTDDNIYYINVKPYVYCLTYEDMLDRLFDRLFDSNIFIQETMMHNNINVDECKKELIAKMNRYTFEYVKKSKIEYKIDKLISKKIIERLYNFFNKFYRSTTLKIKNTNPSVNKTRKIKLVKE